MVEVKSVKIDGESIYVFNSAIYIVDSSTGYTLELDLIVSEIVERKYGEEENLILEIELLDGQTINTIMHVQRLSGGLPKLNLYCDLNDIGEYQNFQVFSENNISFPQIEEGVSIEDIRKIEMPNEQVRLKLTLPIDQAEWIKKQKQGDLNEIIREAISEYWKKRASD
ncbi:hypothetical protein [Peribacillus glennii]|uniref:Uncharacterized protein n=1 Tax=Peribacillus glennii TaxID=2303991 RepID=A0A372L8M1_9BACI|nr:hypothetical protein [Peribacillus glennii]RFU61245.1 hypothetical protein D0466_18700 [Peribacillus glennii]